MNKTPEHILKRVNLRHKKLANVGLCVTCGKKTFPGNKRCAVCLYNVAAGVRRWRARHSEWDKTYNKQVRHKTHEERMRNNQCICCAAPLLEGEYKWCTHCRTRDQRIGIRGGYNEINH